MSRSPKKTTRWPIKREGYIHWKESWHSSKLMRRQLKEQKKMQNKLQRGWMDSYYRRKLEDLRKKKFSYLRQQSEAVQQGYK
jgi:hypothetical protein